jgi:hypothetical protein
MSIKSFGVRDSWMLHYCWLCLRRTMLIFWNGSCNRKLCRFIVYSLQLSWKLFRKFWLLQQYVQNHSYLSNTIYATALHTLQTNLLSLLLQCTRLLHWHGLHSKCWSHYWYLLQLCSGWLGYRSRLYWHGLLHGINSYIKIVYLLLILIGSITNTW